MRQKTSAIDLVTDADEAAERQITLIESLKCARFALWDADKGRMIRFRDLDRGTPSASGSVTGIGVASGWVVCGWGVTRTDLRNAPLAKGLRRGKLRILPETTCARMFGSDGSFRRRSRGAVAQDLSHFVDQRSFVHRIPEKT